MERVTGNFTIKAESVTFTQIRALAAENGIIPIEYIETLNEGRNSQVYVLAQGKNRFIVKKYYRNAEDLRNRLESEFSFLALLEKNGVDRVAKPIAFDSENSLGLYSYLPGEMPRNVNLNLIHQAGEFIRLINEMRLNGLAQRLPEASEACFSIRAHITCVKKRVRMLLNHVPENSIEYEASSFVQLSLVPILNKITRQINQSYMDSKMEQTLSMSSRIVSPSDFGFQNTLLHNSMLYFLDFEYAGLDDPAKLICDFGCHPEIPVDQSHFQKFKTDLYSWLERAEETITRSEILMPLYRLKWCCIMLNEFTSLGKRIRCHAHQIIDPHNQLQKSISYFERYLA